VGSVRVVNEKERERRSARIEAQKSHEGGGVWEECAPSPEFFFQFLSGSGAFWSFLGTCFNVSIRRVKQSRKEVSHMANVSSMIIVHTNTHIWAVRHTCSLRAAVYLYILLWCILFQEIQIHFPFYKKRTGTAFPCVPNWTRTLTEDTETPGETACHFESTVKGVHTTRGYAPICARTLLLRKEPPRDEEVGVSLYKMDIESFKYDRPAELQQLVISAGRLLMMSGYLRWTFKASSGIVAVVLDADDVAPRNPDLPIYWATCLAVRLR